MAILTIEAGPYTSQLNISNERLLGIVDLMVSTKEDMLAMVISELAEGEAQPTEAAIQQMRLDKFVQLVGRTVMNEAKSKRRAELNILQQSTLATEFLEDWEN